MADELTLVGVTADPCSMLHAALQLSRQHPQTSFTPHTRSHHARLPDRRQGRCWRRRAADRRQASGKPLSTYNALYPLARVARPSSSSSSPSCDPPRYTNNSPRSSSPPSFCPQTFPPAASSTSPSLATSTRKTTPRRNSTRSRQTSSARSASALRRPLSCAAAMPPRPLSF